MIIGDLQHNIEVVDVDKKQTGWRPKGQKRNVAKLRDEPCRQLFEFKIKEFMSDNIHDLCGSLKEGVLKACDEAFGYKKT